MREIRNTNTPKSFLSGKLPLVLLTAAVMVSFFYTLVFSGMLKVDKGHASFGRKISEKDAANDEAQTKDELLDFCYTNGTALHKPYVIRSVIQSFDAELTGLSKDSLLIKERISYDLLALEDINKKDDVFMEDYSTIVAGKAERWFGINTEEKIAKAPGQQYKIPLICKSGESRTILTGADFYYKYPLQQDRKKPFRNTSLGSNEDLWVYPNTEDVIGKLTILFTSKSLQFEPLPLAALHSIERGDSISGNDTDAFYNPTAPKEGQNNTVSYTWYKMLPGETVGLKLKWK